MLAYQTEEAIEQDLRDAGCDESCIREFMEDMSKNKDAERMKVLRRHCSKLSDALHRKQKRINAVFTGMIGGRVLAVEQRILPSTRLLISRMPSSGYAVL